MVVVKPFCGVRYNPHSIEAVQSVVSQPYDRIDTELQQQYYDLSPYNIVRIINGQSFENDQPGGPNVYTRARAYYRQWLQEKVLIREDQPALYVYEQSFSTGNHRHVRLGMIAAVKLADFDEGIILPHERTHAGPKEDRLRLLSTLAVNTEQIFMLYPDPQNSVDALLRQAIDGRAPDIDVVEIFENDVRQRIWIVTDLAVISAVQARMAPMRNLIIADGHHRYETGLNYRNAQRQAHPDASPDAAFNYIAATLVSMDDPGLVVLPTHREICNFTATSPASVLDRARPYFDIEASPDLAACLERIDSHPTGHAFGFYGGPAIGFHILTLKDDDLVNTLIPGEHSRTWKSLSVSVLHKILLEQIAQLPLQGVEDKTMIRYHRDPQEAVDNVRRGEGNFVFFLSSTRIEQIKRCAAQGEKMPQKSTDFYPKMISGLVLFPVDVDQVLGS